MNLDLFELIGLRLSAKWWVVVGCFGEAFLACKTFVEIFNMDWNQNSFFTWGVTGLAPPELLILCWRSGALGFVGFDFTWILQLRLVFLASFKDLNLIGIGRIGLDFIGIRRIWLHFVWIWGQLWWTNSWGSCPLPLFWSRLFHSDVVCHPVGLWSSLVQNFHFPNCYYLDFHFLDSNISYGFVTFPV